ncbi:PhzF family phenazine biosynthesis protein [Photobacterium rosenbergii]|uniref:PhzF family phenazine biosynthesis protein n=1 Tax=Photobacterium rosenbergii TaxID=294936 RepID=A0A2T3NKY6_9GAMM|nr:PhzF family phenazine biosynthesis protein [Photobacterium rosenbergii]PSW16186.1 PhzF family phenazine biosynthesis protein [Photobacterium rosenbergii]
MKAQIYDVFCSDFAKGNPCAVVELLKWPDEAELLSITQELAQPVTSFVVESDSGFDIRWFSLEGEINLCGHGSLGAGAALISKYGLASVTLVSQYGQVVISKKNGRYKITLPGWRAQQTPIDKIDFKISARDVFSTRDLILVLESEDAVANFVPDFDQMNKIEDIHAVIVTAQSSSDSYVLRYFAPKIGIDEDLATGSAQCSLAPYWFNKLGVTKLSARQISTSGGYFEIEQAADASIVVSAQVKLRL